jgi:ribosomal protein L1
MKKGKKYTEAAKLVEKETLYEMKDAVDLVQKTSTSKFDATVEAHIRLGGDSRSNLLGDALAGRVVVAESKACLRGILV